jgi:hypothetical protein
MLTPDQITAIFNATRPFTYQAFAAAVERAAREAVLKEITEAFHESIRQVLREDL